MRLHLISQISISLGQSFYAWYSLSNAYIEFILKIFSSKANKMMIWSEMGKKKALYWSMDANVWPFQQSCSETNARKEILLNSFSCVSKISKRIEKVFLNFSFLSEKMENEGKKIHENFSILLPLAGFLLFGSFCFYFIWYIFIL